MMVSSIAENLAKIRAHMVGCERQFARAPHSVSLLAVSKTQSISNIRSAFNAGQKAFAENYWQEAREKQQALIDLPIEWHFIGHLQSRKAREVARHFHWLHTLSRADVLPKLDQGAQNAERTLQVCIQVNISGEASKSGCAPSEVFALAKEVHNYPHLALRGLMAIPAPVAVEDSDEKIKRQPFAKLSALMQSLKNDPRFANEKLDTLSMGMSDDYPFAIAEGATIIRLGTAIFGARPAVAPL